MKLDKKTLDLVFMRVGAFRLKKSERKGWIFRDGDIVIDKSAWRKLKQEFRQYQTKRR